MCVVLSKRTHPRQSRKDPRLLEAMKAAKIGITNGEITVRVLMRSKQIAVTWAVHRFNAILSIFHVHEEHVIVESFVVPGGLPQVGFVDEWGNNFSVSVSTV